MRQSGHGQSAENEETARHHEGSHVVASDVLEKPLGHENTQRKYSGQNLNEVHHASCTLEKSCCRVFCV